MNTPENTTTRIDGKAVTPETETPMPADPAASSAESAPVIDETEPPATSKPPTAEEQMAALQAEVTKNRDDLLRGRADLENTRKRLQREKEDAVKYANASLLERLLPVVDNFELGLSAAKSSPETAAIVSGMAMVQKQLESFLSESGMQTLGAPGEKFDPNLHDALGEEGSDEVPEGQVLRVQRKGYKLKERLLRPASVFVSKGKG